MRTSVLKTKSGDKNVNTFQNNKIQTNKFMVLDDNHNDSDGDHDNHHNNDGNKNKLDTTSNHNNDKFTTVRTDTNNNSVENNDGFISVKKHHESKSRFNKKLETERISKFGSVTDNSNNFTSSQFMTEKPFSSNFQMHQSEQPQPPQPSQPLQIQQQSSQTFNGVSKFATSKRESRESNTDGDTWEQVGIRKQKQRRESDQEGKQLYTEDAHNTNETNDELETECFQTTDKQLYVETRMSALDLGNNMFLHCPWTVWTHKENCDDWTEKSYTNVYEIDSIGKFWRFFNNFHLFDKKENQFFIMRKKIKPIWEDNENRKGGIYSIKFDTYSRPGKIDAGTEMMMCICLLIMNETFLLNNSEINGISYAIKNRSVFIKIWSKNYTTNMPDKIPTSLMIKFDNVLRSLDRTSHYNKKSENKISVMYKPIRPEDE